ncbi:helix-turn-helix domain-containing protein [Sphingomonas baiyangensis]|uniref:Helix-turn-helix transcriptional regulator n=1 Tax=Sphingomonas baiyangensis TaxID=2572576 RepID=A0A4U1L7X2_9SPHN|nr:helix-turn-helix transcriptional regulator [Sphingomonas baiyangensis]TKD53049.1 helix-turn-helix transcriptional regulator [Sphingomonas baiyangensis]
MITAIREVRRARNLTLEDVARRCDPPTTAQTIGRLETGMRTVSVGWLNRIAAALGVDAADLVRLPERPDIAVAALLDGNGATAPQRAASVVPPRAEPDMVAVLVRAAVADYRAGDQLWCRRLAPDAFASALNRDVLVPGRAGRYGFGRLVQHDGLALLPLDRGARAEPLGDPAWIAVATQLVRAL